jgi:uncharacterized protein with HEPN domain
MERFRKDKERLFEIIKSIDETQAAMGVMKFEDFIKGAGAREEIVHQLRGIGGTAKQLSEDFKLSYRNIDWNLLLDLQFAASSGSDDPVDPSTLWYIVENDLPIVKDQVFDITSVLQDKEDDAFCI